MEFTKQLNTSKYTKGVNTCEYIIVHHTASGTFESNMNYLALSKAEASVHYVLGENGEIGKIGEDNNILWHAGLSSRKGKTDINKYSIGIEVVGPNSEGGFYQAQKDKLPELLRYICQNHNIPKENILRHKDIAPSRKIDIADIFWNSDFYSWVEYINSLFTNNLIMGDYKQVYENAIKETGVEPIFTNFEEDGQIKYLLGAGLARLEYRLFKKK